MHPGRKALKMTVVRLPENVILKIDEIDGKGKRSKFITTDIENELKRQKRIQFVQESAGLIPDVLLPDRLPGEGDDTLAYVNRMRAADRKAAYVIRESENHDNND